MLFPRIAKRVVTVAQRKRAAPFSCQKIRALLSQMQTHIMPFGFGLGNKTRQS